MKIGMLIPLVVLGGFLINIFEIKAIIRRMVRDSRELRLHRIKRDVEIYIRNPEMISEISISNTKFFLEMCEGFLKKSCVLDRITFDDLVREINNGIDKMEKILKDKESVPENLEAV
jgi:hypothetical protein